MEIIPDNRSLNEKAKDSEWYAWILLFYLLQSDYPNQRLWEEFSLALPVKPLCRPDCRGLCPECGKNLNEGACGCSRDSGDPRLAALRQLKVKHQG